MRENGPINIIESEGLEYLADAEGLTLYFNLNDENEDGSIVPTCDAVCEETRPPYLMESSESINRISDDSLRSTVNVFEREDGRLQYAIGTKLVYKYQLDTVSGDMLGVDEGNQWMVLRP
ncbi:MAG: hypothetical protein WDZ64_00425 [Parcubacteria group bacterium]